MGNEELDIVAMVDKLMRDPAALEIVKKLKEAGTGGTSVQPEGSVESGKDGGSENAGNSSVSDGMSPEMLAKLPEMMSALSPLIGNAGKAGNTSDKDTENRNKLLIALKPYLNDNRRGMIDTVMSLSKITSLMDLMPKGKQ